MQIQKLKRQVLVAITLVSIPWISAYAIFDREALFRVSGNITRFIVACSYVLGFWFIYSAIQELKVYGQARTMMPLNSSFTGPLAKFLIGTVLMYLPSMVQVGVWTLWNYDVHSSQFIMYPDATHFHEAAIVAVVIIRIIGYVSFVRGFVMLSRIAHQSNPPGMTGKAILHIIGGLLAINIMGTLKIMEATWNAIFVGTPVI